MQDLDGLYWKPVDEALLTRHAGGPIHCEPLFFTLTLTPESLACELLVRTRNRMRCDCMGYATNGPAQLDRGMDGYSFQETLHHRSD